MKHTICMDIDVDESKKLCITNCPFLAVKYHGNEPDTGCRIFDEQETGMIRCQACLDADVTDMLSELGLKDYRIETLHGVLDLISAENAALKKSLAVLERAMEIMVTPSGSYIFPHFIKYAIDKSIEQAQKELEDGDG